MMPGDFDTARGRVNLAAIASPLPSAAADVSSPIHGRGLLLLFAVSAGLSVSNIYYAQPLLDTLSEEFGISQAAIGLVMTTTQIGYAAGLLFLAPLGDLLNRRRLVLCQFLLSTMALLIVACASRSTTLLLGMGLVGLLAVVTQVLVAYGADLARPGERGHTVGVITTGIIIGILLARTVSGTLSDLFGWRSVYVASSAAMAVLAMLLARSLPSRDDRALTLSYIGLVRSVVTLVVEERVLRVRATVALLIFSALMTAWTPMAIALSAPPYLLSDTQIGLFGFAGAMGAVGAARAGRLADRGLAQQTSRTGLVIMTLAWLPISLLSWSPWMLAAGVMMIDFGLQSVHVANQTLIHRVRPEARSRLTAAYMIFYSVGCALGSLASTLIYSVAGWSGNCLLGAGFSALAFIFWVATRHDPSNVAARPGAADSSHSSLP